MNPHYIDPGEKPAVENGTALAAVLSHQKHDDVSSADERYITPAHHTAVSRKKGLFFLQVQLHKVPFPQIQLDVESNKITVSTPRWSRHYHLEYASQFIC